MVRKTLRLPIFVRYLLVTDNAGEILINITSLKFEEADPR